MLRLLLLRLSLWLLRLPLWFRNALVFEPLARKRDGARWRGDPASRAGEGVVDEIARALGFGERRVDFGGGGNLNGEFTGRNARRTRI